MLGRGQDPMADPDYRAYSWQLMLSLVGTYPDVTAPSVRSAASQKRERELDRDPLRERPFSRFTL